MAQQDNTTFENTFNDPTTGLFKTNGTGAIEGVDLQTLVTNIKDSFLNKSSNLSDTDTSNIGVFQKKTTISSAEILAWNTSPVTLVPAPGAGYIIVPISVFVWINYNSSPYATNTDLQIRSSTHVWDTITGVLNQTSDYFFYESIDEGNNSVDIRNQRLAIRSTSGNPTAGNSPIEVTVFYRVVSVS